MCGFSKNTFKLNSKINTLKVILRKGRGTFGNFQVCHCLYELVNLHSDTIWLFAVLFHRLLFIIIYKEQHASCTEGALQRYCVAIAFDPYRPKSCPSTHRRGVISPSKVTIHVFIIRSSSLLYGHILLLNRCSVHPRTSAPTAYFERTLHAELRTCIQSFHLLIIISGRPRQPPCKACRNRREVN